MMPDDYTVEEEFGMSQEYMNMLMGQHLDQCPVNGNHEANIDEGTGAVVWGPCTEVTE